MKFNHIFLVLFSVLLLTGCSSKAEKNDQTPETVNDAIETEMPEASQISESKELLAKYYEIPHIKKFYERRIKKHKPKQDNKDADSDTFSYPEYLSDLSYADLRLLRNEIFARNGYLFQDAFLRGYFNRFKWYMPIFGVDDFKVVLNKKEQDMVNSILREEKKRKSQMTVKSGDLDLYNEDLVVNYQQFKDVPFEIREDLKRQNFSIIDADRPMPFYVYDKNAYNFIPHYITTDLYLFILHKYFSRFLEKLDENFLCDELQSLLSKTSYKLAAIKKTNSSFALSGALEWAQTYNAIAQYALGDSLATPASNFRDIFDEEIQNINAQSTPRFISNPLVSYSELKPRGHYTKSDKLKKYFRGFKWISLNGINLDDDVQIRDLMVYAHVIKNDPEIYRQYKRYVETIGKIAGEEDNLSIWDLINALPDCDINDVLAEENVQAVRRNLKNLHKERIKKVFGESFETAERSIIRVYFISSTYSISGEIFSRLVHIDHLNSKRPFPKGLDIPAVFGDKTARNILLNEYHEDSLWSDYLPKLDSLQEQFQGFDEWDENYGFKGVETAFASFSERDIYPDFLKTDAYNRKELSTALASWTHVKHDLILYQEKPYAAECGQGGGPEPPLPISYVEPNLQFWDTALELVKWLKQLSKYDPTYDDELKRIEKLGEKLRNVAYKQVRAQAVTDQEYRELHYIGGIIEYIFLGLLETDHIPKRERSMALIADVYIYADYWKSDEQNLNVAVGHADDIYVVIPIKGNYQIARGAVFSYYEFKGKIYNDEEWRARIKEGNQPDRPEWIKPLIHDIPSPEGQGQYRFSRFMLKHNSFGR